MYKFTNGMVVFDEKTKNEYINAGFKLVVDKSDSKEEIDGNKANNDRTIKEEYSRSNKQITTNKN